MTPSGIVQRIKTSRLGLLARKHRIPLLLFLVVWLSFFHNLGTPPLFDRDEGAFSEATREMLERNDYISTYLNGAPRYDKPILIYWFQAVSVAGLGVNEFAFRFPSAVFASLWVLAVFLFVGRYGHRETAWVAALITAASAWVQVIGRAATADALLNLLIALSVFDVYRFYAEDQPKHLYRVFLWAGLATLTKGPVGLAIPIGVSLLYFAWQRELKRWFRSAVNPVGLLILIGVTVPWYVAQYLKEGQPFIDGFFLRHNVNRFLAPMEGHGGSVLYYLLFLPLIVLPFTALLVPAFARLRRIATDQFDRLLWIWFLFVLVLFTVSGTKLPHYLLHGCTPLFILMAEYRESLRPRWAALLPVFVFVIALLLLPTILDTIEVRDAYAAAMIRSGGAAFDLGYFLWIAVGTALVLATLFMRSWPIWRSLMAAGVINAFIAGHVFVPVLGQVLQGPVKEAALFSKGMDDVVMWGMDNPSILVYREELTPDRKPVAGETVITKVNNLTELESHDVLFQEGGVCVANVHEPGG